MCIRNDFGFTMYTCILYVWVVLYSKSNLLPLPYLEIHKSNENNFFAIIHRTNIKYIRSVLVVSKSVFDKSVI